MGKFLRGQWKDLTEILDRYSIVYMEGVLLVPVLMFAFFYPVEVAIAVGALLLVALAAFEVAEWVWHHPHHPRHRTRHASSFRFPL